MSLPFNGNMLFLARQLRRMGQEELVALLENNINQGQLSKIERGRIQPDMELVDHLARALKVQPSFFTEASYLRQPPVSFHRARKALSARDEAAIHARSEFYRLCARKIFSEIELEAVIPPAPSIDVEQFNGDVKQIARVVRQRWKIQRGPIADITTLIEDAGIVIIPYEFGTPLIDGFCQHSGDGLPPIIFVNASLSKDRLRFSLAHELGHLVMHDVPNPEQEMQANEFASEFLMPSDDIRDHFFDLKLSKFMELKLHWGTSMQALITKAWQIGKLSDRQYKYFFVELSKRGWRKKEPVDVEHLKERPATLKAAIEAHLNQLGYTEQDLGEMFGIMLEELQTWFPVQTKRPLLRLVANRP